MVKLLCSALLIVFILKPAIIKGLKTSIMASDAAYHLPEHIKGLHQLNKNTESDGAFRKRRGLEPLEKSAVRILGDQASDGKCFGFSFDDSGTSRYYICCNNCYKSLPSFTPVCDGLTYQRGSSASYCNSCGVDKSTTTSLFKNEFYCGGCSGQDFVNQTCASTWVNVPATCWVFVSCMKTICVNMFEEFGTLSNCGNGYCNIEETSTNCPIDCCFQKNDSCTWGSECLPTCCGETSCCGKSSGDMLTVGIGVFVLIAMVCCNFYQGSD